MEDTGLAEQRDLTAGEIVIGGNDAKLAILHGACDDGGGVIQEFSLNFCIGLGCCL